MSAIMEPRDMRLEDLEDVEELRRRVTRAQEQAAKAQNEVERKNEQWRCFTKDRASLSRRLCMRVTQFGRGN